MDWQEKSAKLIYIGIVITFITLLVALGLILKDLLFIFILALCINFLLAKPVNFLAKNIHNRGLSIAIIFISILISLFFILKAIFPILGSQFTNLTEILPSIADQINNLSQDINQQFNTNFNFSTEIKTFINEVNKPNLILGSFKHSIYLLTMFVMITIVSFYLLLDGNKAWELFTRLFPKTYKEDLSEIKRRIDTNLNLLILGQFKIACIASVVMLLAYIIVGSHLAFLLGSLQLLEFIPIFGTWTAFIPSFIVIMTTLGKIKALIVLGIYLVFSQIVRDHILVPKIMGDAFGMHPLAIILGLSLGFKAFGPIGIIVALPLIGIVSAVIHFLLDQREA